MCVTEFFESLKQALRSARKIEYLLLVAVMAVIGLMLISYSDDTSEATFEERTQDVISSMNGVGNVNVVINRGADNEVLGALVVAEGAGDMKTYLEIQKAVGTLLGIEISRIEVVEMGD